MVPGACAFTGFDSTRVKASSRLDGGVADDGVGRMMPLTIPGGKVNVPDAGEVVGPSRRRAVQGREVHGDGLRRRPGRARSSKAQVAALVSPSGTVQPLRSTVGAGGGPSLSQDEGDGVAVDEGRTRRRPEIEGRTSRSGSCTWSSTSGTAIVPVACPGAIVSTPDSAT